jgi:hypothetical protein
VKARKVIEWGLGTKRKEEKRRGEEGKELPKKTRAE